MGRTLSKIRKECKVNMEYVENLNPNLIKSNMQYYPVPEEEEWRVGCLTELLNDDLEVPGFTENEIKEFVNYTCSN